jgi:hypothetical protein
MSTAVCPRCGLTEFRTDEQGLADAGIWAEEFVRMCEHVHERRHLKICGPTRARIGPKPCRTPLRLRKGGTEGRR